MVVGTSTTDLMLIRNELDIHSFRYERKFIIDYMSKHAVEVLLKMHPAMFSETYERRWVNSIYFDTYELNNYVAATTGTSYRMKLRIRWYGDLFGRIKEPVLEYKIKSGMLCNKITMPLSELKVDETLEYDCIVECIRRSDIADTVILDFLSLVPTLCSRYLRKYYQSADGSCRATLDGDIEYYRVGKYNNAFRQKVIDKTTNILELKYKTDEDDRIHFITSHFPFRLSKNSKYCKGIEALSGFGGLEESIA